MQTRDNGRAQLCEKVLFWSQRLKVEPRIIRVQRMTRKWGSCSTSGIITLAEDLIEQEPGFQDFVIAHELLHLRVPTHGRLFQALMSLHLPNWRTFDVSRRSRFDCGRRSSSRRAPLTLPSPPGQRGERGIGARPRRPR
jgi:predicted metal-dependent hydrolase